MRGTKSYHQGTALISALFIMTLVAIAATAMSLRLELDIYRTRLSILSDKLSLAAQLVPFWALNELANPKQKFTRSDAAGKVLDFPIQLQASYPAMQIKGGLYDLQARFNLNNLSDQKYPISFQALLKNTAQKLEAQQRNKLGFILYHWLSPYQPGHDPTHSLPYYLKQKPAYYPAQQLMQSASEFRLLMGVNAPLYRSLENYLTALPEQTAININTASKPVLMSLGFGLTESQAEELIAARGKDGMSNLSPISPLLEKFHIRPEQLTTESNYFMSVAFVKAEDLNRMSYTLLKRQKDKNGKITVSILSTSLNWM